MFCNSVICLRSGDNDTFAIVLSTNSQSICASGK